MKKFILLTAEDEPNIAVLEIDTKKMTSFKNISPEEFSDKITEQLKEALDEHFDAEVLSINSIELKSVSPIRATANVSIDHYEKPLTIELNETWVYS